MERNEAGVKEFKMEMSNGGVTKDVTFVTIEQWDHITFPAPTGKKYKDCEVKIVASSDARYIVDSRLRVKRLYDDMKNRVFGAAGVAPAFDLTITEVATGTTLNLL